MFAQKPIDKLGNQCYNTSHKAYRKDRLMRGDGKYGRDIHNTSAQELPLRTNVQAILS